MSAGRPHGEIDVAADRASGRIEAHDRAGRARGCGRRHSSGGARRNRESQGRPAEAREWAERILRKKATMPNYIRRRERPWFRKAAALLKRVPKA